MDLEDGRCLHAPSVVHSHHSLNRPERPIFRGTCRPERPIRRPERPIFLPERPIRRPERPIFCCFFSINRSSQELQVHMKPPPRLSDAACLHGLLGLTCLPNVYRAERGSLAPSHRPQSAWPAIRGRLVKKMTTQPQPHGQTPKTLSRAVSAACCPIWKSIVRRVTQGRRN